MWKKSGVLLFLAPTVIILLVLSIFPLIYNIYLSFQKTGISPEITTEFIGLKNYVKIFSDPFFWNVLKNTLIFIFSVLVVEIVLGLIVAMSIRKLFEKSVVFRTIVLMPLMITPAVVALLWRLMYNADFGIINYLLSIFGVNKIQWLSNPSMAMVSLVIIDTWQWLPFVILFFITGLSYIPKEYFEMARIDGANFYIKLKYIIFPLLKKTFLVILLFRVLDSLKIFETIFILTDGGPGVATEQLTFWSYKYMFKFFNFGYGAAISVILLITSIIFCLFLVKFFNIDSKKKNV